MRTFAVHAVRTCAVHAVRKCVVHAVRTCAVHAVRTCAVHALMYSSLLTVWRHALMYSSVLTVQRHALTVQRHTLTYSTVPMVCNLLLAELPKDSQFRWLVLRKDKQEAHKPVYMCPTHGEDGWGEWVRKMVYFCSMPSEFLYGRQYWHLWLHLIPLVTIIRLIGPTLVYS